ncbi:ATP-dependent RNA helicase HrpA [Aliikangiella coralliicola]|uniref:RNA helicase n=1 Tax=Aliikangiella coralliicola TaxID=2592383 RepID=A0A545U0J1_9GAMM|nr:ATP-dependent RNA helicase HrpA [Aliikangiella coralliicola]TQV82985.1 ATP-dependent RNA helicase HrpA [Aliikangiella coralliicola]
MELHQLQTKHQGKVFHLQKTINQRSKQGLAVDQLQAKLKRLVESSNSETLKNRIEPETISIPHELPIANESDEIVSLLQNHQVIIVAGETGCGKTTQLPKLCVKAGLGARGLIAHTQPRRVAATSVAKRIAEEMNTELGDIVGFSVRFNNKSSDKTRIKLMTDGVLLTEIESDPLLSRYEVIIIDEAHERSLNIDFLLGFLKTILSKRKDLKVIITSATIDPQKFSKNFNNAPMVNVAGRSYPVEVRYRPQAADNDVERQGAGDSLMDSVLLAVDECCGESTGNILIFADGEGQIKNIVKQLKNANLSNSEILPLYARLSINEQQKIFSASNKRKIIVSTNVAETSLTVPGIIFVIDIGTARISRFSQRNKIQQLPVEKISQASADQRKGRCGRIAPGICIRLYSEEDYLQRHEFTSPEIKRTNLSSVALRLKAMKVNDVESFPFIEQPSDRAWKVAFNSLFELGAIDEQQRITTIGRQMAKLPVDPQLARILVQPDLVAVDEMLVICSLMSVREIRERPHDKQQKADQLHAAYHQSDSDILTAIKLWRDLQAKRAETSSNGFRQWCSKNLINFLGWLEWRRVYSQLKEAVAALGIKINENPCQEDEVHSALIPGFITHIFQKTQEQHYQGVRGLKVWVHPSSLSFKKRVDCLLSAEMIETEKLYARMNCQVKPQWIEKYSQHLMKSRYDDIHWRKKSGKVMAYLSQTLLGLPLVNRRLVNYSTIDLVRSREIFLKDGLALDQLAEDFPFLRANRQKLAQLEEQEQRQRQNNIRVDSDSLMALYAEHLPSHICSLVSLKKWLKRDFKKRNQQLSFSIEALTNNLSDSQEAYPSQITIKGFDLNLSYCFAPGSEEDGVSVEIPQNMLSQFSDRDFDWLVPGYLEEKVLATIKSLPKSLRRDLIPLGDTATKCCEMLWAIDQTGKLFINELAKVLQRLTGKHIQSSDFNLENVEPHLKMKYKILGGRKTDTNLRGKNSSGSNKALKSITSLSSDKISRFEEKGKTAIKKQEKFQHWVFGNFQIEQEISQNNFVSRIFQGLQDFGSHVKLVEFPTKQSALKSHIVGVSRLILIANQTHLNKMFNAWPEKSQLEKLSIRFDGFRMIFDVLALAYAKSLISSEKRFASNGELDESGFKKLCDQFQQNFRVVMAEQLNALLPLAKLREAIASDIGGLNESSFTDSISDMRGQLQALWQTKYLLSAEEPFFENYTRYHKAIKARIKRIKENYPKEQNALDTWLAWHSWWNELTKQKSGPAVENELERLFWTLQEFRISLFSPGIKVKGGVSAKKLQTLFEQVEVME